MSVDILDKFGLGDEESRQEVVNIPLSHDDIAELLELLSFTSSTAGFVAQQELLKGGENGIKAASKMNRYSSNARVLMEYILKHAKIGEPDGEVH